MVPLEFQSISYQEPIYHLEQLWGRKLTDHEKNVVVQTYRITRTLNEAEEIKMVEDLRHGKSSGIIGY